MIKSFFERKENEEKMLLPGCDPEEELPENGETELERLRRENDRLRKMSVCAELKVPLEAAEFVYALADIRCGREDIPFEDAAAGVWAELCSCFEKVFAEKKRAEGRYITTGVRGSRSEGGSDGSLRKAFGLK